MIRRMYFPLVALFWVAMNVLLWRSEMSSRSRGGSAVPVSVVWARILNAPDESALEVFHQGRRLGHCRWSANVGEASAAGNAAGNAEEIEGRIRRLAGYTLDLEGNVLLSDTPQRLRFGWHAEFGTNQLWRQMNLRATLRPNTWEVRANAIDQTVVLRHDDPQDPWERTFTFADLTHPDRLLAGFGLPPVSLWLSALAPPTAATNFPPLELGIQWEARTDWLTVGQAHLRVYRLRASLFDKYEAIIYVSRAGEILQVELPSDVVLKNDALAKP